MAQEKNLLNLKEAYRAAHEDAVLVDRSALGMLKFTGETRLDLINRMSTQNVIDLKPGQGAATVLTTDIGRIIDRLILYTGRKAVYCLTGEDNGSNIAQYLMRFVFFMDDFQVEDLSDNTSIFALYGPRSVERIQELSGQLPDLALHHWAQANIAESTVYIHRTDPIAGDGILLTLTKEDEAKVASQLSASGLRKAGESAFDYLRIEAGLPRFGHELTSDYIPLESSLWSDVSFNKGCYTGQEIIARMESRGRLAKKLVRLKLAQAVDPGTGLISEGKAAGSVTSIGQGPAGVLALGYVKTGVLESGGKLLAGDLPVELIST